MENMYENRISHIHKSRFISWSGKKTICNFKEVFAFKKLTILGKYLYACRPHKIQLTYFPQLFISFFRVSFTTNP